MTIMTKEGVIRLQNFYFPTFLYFVCNRNKCHYIFHTGKIILIMFYCTDRTGGIHLMLNVAGYDVSQQETLY